MRVMFGGLFLLIVLAIVGSLAAKQLHALNGRALPMSGAASAVPADAGLPTDRDDTAAGAAGGLPGATAAAASGLGVAQQSRDIEQRFRDETTRALQQGADRNAREAQ